MHMNIVFSLVYYKNSTHYMKTLFSSIAQYFYRKKTWKLEKNTTHEAMENRERTKNGVCNLSS